MRYPRSKGAYIGLKSLRQNTRKFPQLAEVNFNLLCAAAIGYDDFCHFGWLLFCFLFFTIAPSLLSRRRHQDQIFSATLSFALLARGLLTLSILSATIGFFVIIFSSDSIPFALASRK